MQEAHRGQEMAGQTPMTVYIVCNDQRDIGRVFDTYAAAYARIDAILRAEGVVEGTPEWARRHAQWDIVQRMVESGEPLGGEG